MASGSGFYKGEKKKPKKAKDSKIGMPNFGPAAPTFTLPKVIPKKKNNE